MLNRIFSEYQSGMSLLEIASRLNDENIEYQIGVTGWNKSRIKSPKEHPARYRPPL